MRTFRALMVAGGLCLVLWPGTASAELTLWIKYHHHGVEMFDQAHYNEAETLFDAAKRESEITLRPENFRLANSLDGLGQVYIVQGRYDEAEEVLDRALRMKRQVLGAHEREVPKTVSYMAELKYYQGDYPMSERLYRQTLLILVRDQYNVYVARALDGLATLYINQGKLVEAEALLERALKLHLDAGRRWHQHAALVQMHLGELYVSQGRYEEAEPLYRQGLAVQRRTIGDAHPDMARMLEGYAALVRYLNRPEEKLNPAEMETEAYEIRQRYATLNPPYQHMQTEEEDVMLDVVVDEPVESGDTDDQGAMIELEEVSPTEISMQEAETVSPEG